MYLDHHKEHSACPADLVIVRFLRHFTIWVQQGAAHKKRRRTGEKAGQLGSIESF